MAQRPQPQTDTGAVRRFAFELPALTASVARARRLAEERLIIWGCGPEIRDTVSLVVSELVTNAVVHTASGRFVCELREGEEKLRIAVWDEGGSAGRGSATAARDEAAAG